MNVWAKRLTVIAILMFAIFAAGRAKQLSAATPSRGETVGVNFNCLAASSTDHKVVYSTFSQAQVGWVRIYLPWFSVEPSLDQYDSTTTGAMARFTACVDEAHAAGYKVLVVFLNNPGWASRTWNTPPNPRYYASALGYLANRFREQVQAWEVWNEENTRFFWRGTAGQYVQMLRTSYRAVKKSNPGALVVFGGTAHNDAGWIRKCYRAGARGYFDVLATHPYPHIRWHKRMGLVIGSVQKIHDIMAANGDSQVPIWFTEFGWSRSAFTPQRQAHLLYKSLNYIASSLPYVQESFWYEAKTEDPTSAANRWLRGLALLEPTGSPTPAFRALVRYGKSSSDGTPAAGSGDRKSHAHNGKGGGGKVR